ncbi:hypothetical protein AGLY_015307 [Aphis glycines]|uniref:Reverse transcriptase domain-containing protein n=1 Tax=Aphis glycines TaxID=307491 RepID=A0A6G0T1I8_APHGL|nr:hypothetical protein AGLY_015307 [Aphis glycines]
MLQNIYFRLPSSITVDYTIHDIPISNKFSEICCKSLKLMGFIKRISYEFKLDRSLKILFSSLVQPILEYGFVIWNSHFSIDTLMIVKIQQKFVSFAAFLLKISCPSHDYELVRIALNLSSLTDRKRCANLSFFKKLLYNLTDCHTLLSQEGLTEQHIREKTIDLISLSLRYWAKQIESNEMTDRTEK